MVLLIIAEIDLSKRSLADHLFFVINVVSGFDFGYFHE